MNVDHYRQLLLAKEKELLADMDVVESEALTDAGAEVQDESDMAVRGEAQAALFNRNSADYSLLQEVRDALGRIESGTYGKCQRCGEPIGEKRLEAVPWAAFDTRHQEEEDRLTARPAGGATM